MTAFEVALTPLHQGCQGREAVLGRAALPGVSSSTSRIVVDEDVTAERVEQAIVSAGGKLLESVRLFDVYRGTGVAEGRKSMAFALLYRAPDRTLTAEEVEGAHDSCAAQGMRRCGRRAAELAGAAIRRCCQELDEYVSTQRLHTYVTNCASKLTSMRSSV